MVGDIVEFFDILHHLKYLHLQVGFIADLATPNQAIFFFMPDFNIPGLIKSLESYLQYDVDKIVFSHSSNDDILAPGTKEVHRFIIQYLKVRIIL